MEIKKIMSDKLSFYRTHHEFYNYAEFRSEFEFLELLNYSRSNSIDLVILGNGSNILFTRSRIKTLVVKNKLPRQIQDLGNRRFRVSSTVNIGEILRKCEKYNYDSFYYLSSVPATVGGALAMNAGRGITHQKSIYDFVESVVVLRSGKRVKYKREDIEINYRWTEFLEEPELLIVDCVLFFQNDLPTKPKVSPIKERVAWSKVHQDYRGGTCGSVFKEFSPRIMNWLRGFGFIYKAMYSSKTINWINNKSRNVVWVRFLIFVAKSIHFCLGKKCRLELRLIK